MEEEKDFDELQSDIEDEDDTRTFHIGERLTMPKARLYTTLELHTLVHEGVIDLCPAYQRDIVWTEPKQMKLLDSIYRNYYVPPIVFDVYKDDDGETAMRCVDGKQRLTSIQKFLDGQVHKDPITKKNWYYTRAQSHKSSRLEVPEDWKRDFASKQLTCVQYYDLPKGMDRDIFQRVQLGVPLTAAEKLQAIDSPWSDFITELDDRYINCDNGLTTIIDVDMKRGRDFQTLAQFVFCCKLYPERAVPTAQKMEQFVASMEPPESWFKTALKEALTKFWHIGSSKRLNYGFSSIQKRVAPVEFVFIGVILYILRDCPEEVCAEEIYNMRAHVRKQFPDVRARGDIIRCLWGFIAQVVERQDDAPPPVSAKRRASGHKRGKYYEGSEDDDDMNTQTGTRGGKKSKGRR
ncbi:uncharacterized protein C8Q71DRAFT_883466 [Rhodofomes roseus]|uniref:GmrSD restriction endonucleases N-terminal domain-containing protein n=1 Tax=Rhodofomes roseus TaxID=34475 RepID=A0ABQ8K1Y6_9APHY|nr:uncharacterized protein C8Q71DRAFT_883466 [Rhodofomes roseus]KAH9830711.1 hypothetical protein C8Q71DRAFT_883466 [Rhodofomes roseus]